MLTVLPASMLREDLRARPNIYQVLKESCEMMGRPVPVKDVSNSSLPGSSTSIDLTALSLTDIFWQNRLTLHHESTAARSEQAWHEPDEDGGCLFPSSSAASSGDSRHCAYEARQAHIDTAGSSAGNPNCLQHPCPETYTFACESH